MGDILVTRATYDVPEAAVRLGISKLTAYEAIRKGTFPVEVVKIGRRVVVPARALDRLLGEVE